MIITEIRAAGLYGATPEGGWSAELRPEDCVHTLIAVLTDEGEIGLGSVFTNASLVKSALTVLEPLYLGENALEPERVSEKLRQNMFWLGRGGSITHTISGIDIALWDLLGKATGQPVGRLLGGRCRSRCRLAVGGGGLTVCRSRLTVARGRLAIGRGCGCCRRSGGLPGRDSRCGRRSLIARALAPPDRCAGSRRRWVAAVSVIGVWSRKVVVTGGLAPLALQGQVDHRLAVGIRALAAEPGLVGIPRHPGRLVALRL